jgi:hypothetical protein
MILTFGKHSGKDTSDVPLSYIKWLEEQDWITDPLREECQFLINRAEGDRPGAGRVVRKPPPARL